MAKCVHGVLNNLWRYIHTGGHGPRPLPTLESVLPAVNKRVIPHMINFAVTICMVRPMCAERYRLKRVEGGYLRPKLHSSFCFILAVKMDFSVSISK